MIIAIGLATFVSTFLGGLFALKFRDKLHLILGFSAGAVIGVAFFDLIPEALELGNGYYSASSITSFIAMGFMAYMILDRFFFFHSHSHDHDHDHAEDGHTNPRGTLGATSLSVHSLLDGVAIGLAFQVSVAVGAIVAVAVLVHDFSDGINTVSMIVRNNGLRKNAIKWLVIDAVAPVVGVLSTMLFTLPQNALGIILAIFSGFFIYIGASDLLPESHHSHPRVLTTVMTVIGIVVLYFAIKIASF